MYWDSRRDIVVLVVEFVHRVCSVRNDKQTAISHYAAGDHDVAATGITLAQSQRAVVEELTDYAIIAVAIGDILAQNHIVIPLAYGCGGPRIVGVRDRPTNRNLFAYGGVRRRCHAADGEIGVDSRGRGYRAAGFRQIAVGIDVLVNGIAVIRNDKDVVCA